MKRFNLIKKIGIIIGAVLFFAGCKTAPVANHVNPLDLLDGDSAIYFAIPSKVDSVLVSNILKSYVSDLSESDTKAVIDRVDVIYAGINNTRGKVIFQASAACNIPATYHSKIFSKKNGWETSQYTPNKSAVPFNIYKNGGMTISLPDSNTVCLGRDVTKMIDSYQIIQFDGADGGNPNIDEKFYDHLNSAKNEINFFAQKPQSFLTMLTGANLDLKLIYVMGTIKNDPKKDTQYLLDLEFEFLNERYVKPGKALLTLSFGLTDSDNIMISPTNLQIKGIKINKNQLYKVLTFK